MDQAGDGMPQAGGPIHEIGDATHQTNATTDHVPDSIHQTNATAHQANGTTNQANGTTEQANGPAVYSATLVNRLSHQSENFRDHNGQLLSGPVRFEMFCSQPQGLSSVSRIHRLTLDQSVALHCSQLPAAHSVARFVGDETAKCRIMDVAIRLLRYTSGPDGDLATPNEENRQWVLRLFESVLEDGYARKALRPFLPLFDQDSKFHPQFVFDVTKERYEEIRSHYASKREQWNWKFKKDHQAARTNRCVFHDHEYLDRDAEFCRGQPKRLPEALLEAGPELQAQHYGPHTDDFETDFSGCWDIQDDSFYDLWSDDEEDAGVRA